MDKIKIAAVVGPTASGKTRLAVELARLHNGEIVSADSMQIYKYMDIGTAKPTEEERKEIPHHLMDFLEPDRKFSVADYVKAASETITDIHSRGKLPIIAGGTGLYVDSLIQNIQFGEETRDEALREQLAETGEKQGGEALLTILREFDPELANTLHPNNIGRIIRGIEVYKTTGKTMTQRQKESRSVPSPYDCLYIGLTCKDRQILYDRIDRRVDRMIEDGLLKETEALIQMGFSDTAIQAIGYKEMFGFLYHTCTMDEAVAHLKQQTRRYAKRQLTWFRKNPEIHWIETDDGCFERILKQTEKIMEFIVNQ